MTPTAIAALSTFVDLMLPGIKRHENRVAYEKTTGKEAPPPDYARPVKYWYQDNVPASVRRFDYIGMAMQGNVVLMRPAADEPDPVRRQFYADYGLTEVPYLEPIQLSRAEAGIVNLPWDVSPAGEGEYADWLHAGYLAEPRRALAADEAFMPALMSPGNAVNMTAWRAIHPAEGSGSTADAIGQILRQIRLIQASLDRLEARP